MIWGGVGWGGEEEGTGRFVNFGVAKIKEIFQSLKLILSQQK